MQLFTLPNSLHINKCAFNVICGVYTILHLPIYARGMLRYGLCLLPEYTLLVSVLCMGLIRTIFVNLTDAKGLLLQQPYHRLVEGVWRMPPKISKTACFMKPSISMGVFHEYQPPKISVYGSIYINFRATFRDILRVRDISGHLR